VDNWRRKIESASSQDLWLAAKALVDAAYCKTDNQFVDSSKQESSSKRLSLIAAVNNDPKLVEWLFCPRPKQLN